MTENTLSDSANALLSGDLSAAAASIDAAVEAAERGELRSVTDLQKHIEKLCDKLGNLPGADQVAAKNRVVDLLVALDKLTNKLVEQKEALTQQMSSITPSKHAASAYTKATASTDDGAAS